MIDNPISDASDDGAAGTTPDLPTAVSVDDLLVLSITAADLADADLMEEAWR